MELESKRAELEALVRQHNGDLQQPEIIKASEELDKLIVQSMTRK